MNPIVRSSLAGQTEAALLAGIRSGQWKDSLPGVRMLCKTLHISPPTLQVATSNLLKQGVLISRGPRRRLEINPKWGRRSGSAKSPGTKLARVLCLTEANLPQMSHLLLELLAMLRLESPNWDFRHHVVPISGAKAARQQWQRLLDTEQPDAIIAFRGGEVFARWCVAKSVPTVFIGGAPGDTPIPAVGVDTIKPISELVTEFVRLGHRHICMPMFGVFPQTEERQRQAFREAMELAGLPFDPLWHTPSAAQKDPDVVINTLTRISRTRMPTALIVMTWVEFVAINSFLQSHRLRVGTEVSVCLLGSDDSLEWHRPQLSYIDYPMGQVVRQVRQLINKGCPAGVGRVIVGGKLVRGESITRPPG